MFDNFQVILLVLLIGFGLVLLANLILFVSALVFGKMIYEKCISIGFLAHPSKPDIELRKKIAVAAAAAAIAIEDEVTPHPFPLPATAFVSAWQAVMRSDILRRHGRLR
jgi:hypothetical protein